MATTIQISENLQKELLKRKLNPNDTYEEVIWDILEDTLEINEQTKKDITAAIADVKAGRVYTHAQVKKMLGL
jgi:predicted transcriptional regulator